MQGRTPWRRASKEGSLPIDTLLASIEPVRVHRPQGTAVYLTTFSGNAPNCLMHNLKHNEVLHEHVVLLTVQVPDEPYVSPEQRAAGRHLGKGVHRVVLRYGFMEQPDVPRDLARLADQGIPVDPMRTSYFVGRNSFVGAERPLLPRWQQKLFLMLARFAVERRRLLRPAGQPRRRAGQPDRDLDLFRLSPWRSAPTIQDSWSAFDPPSPILGLKAEDHDLATATASARSLEIAVAGNHSPQHGHVEAGNPARIPCGIDRVLRLGDAGSQQAAQQAERHEMQRCQHDDEYRREAAHRSGRLRSMMRGDQHEHDQDGAQSQRPRVGGADRPLRPALQFGADTPGIVLGKAAHRAMVRSSGIGNPEGERRRRIRKP